MYRRGETKLKGNLTWLDELVQYEHQKKELEGDKKNDHAYSLHHQTVNL